MTIGFTTPAGKAVKRFGATAIQIHAEDVPLADGVLWKESTQFGKKAYLVGASNFMSIEYAY